MKTCFIVGAGEENALNIVKNDGDIVVACDGGLRYLDKYGYKPDVIIGDFDSLGYVPTGKEVIKLNVIKDETDVGAALRLFGDKFDRFVLLCCGGGKISHTLANIQNAINVAKRKKEVFIYDKKEILTFVTDGKISFASGKGFFSIFADGMCEGVTITNAKYPLSDAVLKSDFPLGVSNEFVGKTTEISVKKGTLTVAFPIDNPLPEFN